MTTMKRSVLTVACFLFIAALAVVFSGREFLRLRRPDALFPSPGLSEKKLLSDYFPALKGTAGDTDVLIFRGNENGGRILIVGGTHPNEPAGHVAAVLVAENITVTKGEVVVIPRANNSGFTHSEPQEGNPQRYGIETSGGSRSFRLGSRLTNPVDQWPDPAVYVNPAGQKLAGVEGRNLNRCYPGRKDGSLTEKAAFGIMELIRTERIDLGIDIHESAPEYPVTNALVFHEGSSELAATAALDLESQGLPFRLEASPPNLRGLSHREWGDHAKIMAVLVETVNASHGRLKGKPSVSLVVDGKDRFYTRAAKLGRLFTPFPEEGIPLKLRVARHVAAVRTLLDSLGELDPSKKIVIRGLPDPSDIRQNGIGAYLHPPTK